MSDDEKSDDGEGEKGITRAEMKGPDGKVIDIMPLLEGQEVMFDRSEHAGDFTELVAGRTPYPVHDLIEVGGRFRCERELALDDRVLVTVSDVDGVAIGRAYCAVSVGFSKQTAKDYTWVERRHKASVEK